MECQSYQYWQCGWQDVVELYYSAPYYSAAEGGSGLQKAGEVLGGFAKTKELQPGETETVTNFYAGRADGFL